MYIPIKSAILHFLDICASPLRIHLGHKDPTKTVPSEISNSLDTLRATYLICIYILILFNYEGVWTVFRHSEQVVKIVWKNYKAFEDKSEHKRITLVGVIIFLLHWIYVIVTTRSS